VKVTCSKVCVESRAREKPVDEEKLLEKVKLAGLNVPPLL
jgi:hypothetical protein